MSYWCHRLDGTARMAGSCSAETIRTSLCGSARTSLCGSARARSVSQLFHLFFNFVLLYFYLYFKRH